MFTGLVEEIGTVKSLTGSTVRRLVIASSKVINDVNIGDSVAVNGVCLTVTSKGINELSFDAVPETINRSTLKDTRSGAKVNLEASLRAGKMLGGHIMQGHVDGIGKVESIERLAEAVVIRISASSEIMRYVVEKGSVAIDGISLTIASEDEQGFIISVIPHTYEMTTLSLKKPGDSVNLEADIIGKYVEKFVNARKGASAVTEDLLRRTGFM